LLLVLGGFLGCTPNGSSSTGVGNPSVISLSIVTDDEPDFSHQGEGGAASEKCTSGGTSSAGAAASAGEPADASNAGAPSGSSDAGASSAGESSSAGAPSDSSSAGAPALVVDDDELPRRSIHDAVIVIGSLEWLPCDTTRDPTIVNGPFIVNLVGDLVPQGTQPRIPSVVEPPGGFCGIDAPLAPASSPAELAGRSVFFDGIRADGTPFVLYADVPATLRVRRHGSIVWDATATPDVLWAFRPRRWLSRMELDQASPTSADDPSVPVSIDLNRSPLLLAALRHRLAGKSSLFLDVNKNRLLDTEDRDALVGDGLDDPD
jgi:hypothetical protein